MRRGLLQGCIDGSCDLRHVRILQERVVGAGHPVPDKRRAYDVLQRNYQSVLGGL